MSPIHHQREDCKQVLWPRVEVQVFVLPSEDESDAATVLIPISSSSLSPPSPLETRSPATRKKKTTTMMTKTMKMMKMMKTKRMKEEES